jgi:DNA-binding Lrp family transcriptional regulator
VNLKVAQQSWKALGSRLLAIDDVEHATSVSGEYDIVLLVRTRDVGTLRDLVLNKLQEMPEVLSTQTLLIFDDLVATSP